MNALLRRRPPHDENIVSTRPRTHWVDTSVMLEVYSHGDLYQDWGLSRCTKPPLINPKANPEKRRVRLQEALWLAIALATSGAVSMTYQHENLRNILRLAPPDSEAGGWTATILYVLGDGGLFDGWERIATKSGAKNSAGEPLSDLDRDRVIVHACSGANTITPFVGLTAEREEAMTTALGEIREHTPGPLVLVTHDRDLVKRARKVGVDADEPKAIAARTLSRDDARDIFAASLGEATDWYVAISKLTDRLTLERAMERVHGLHAAIWSSSADAWFPPPGGV